MHRRSWKKTEIILSVHRNWQLSVLPDQRIQPVHKSRRIRGRSHVEEQTLVPSALPCLLFGTPNPLPPSIFSFLLFSVFPLDSSAFFVSKRQRRDLFQKLVCCPLHSIARNALIQSILSCTVCLVSCSDRTAFFLGNRIQRLRLVEQS